MKLLYTVQRYGTDIVGGSEMACRMFAERLVERGHEVHVVTSCARRYLDWANEYEPGTSTENGVTVHRLPVSAERDFDKFGPLNDWMSHGPRPVPLFQQQRWMRLMGPELDGYRRWLLRYARDFDVVVHMTYLYVSTTSGLTVTAGRVPTILHATAHDEPSLWARRYDTLFRLPDAFMFFTPEERDIVARRFAFEPQGSVIGIGMDIHGPADENSFRARFGLGDAPYLLYVGRIDPSKGAVEAFKFFTAYKERNPGPLKFVYAGESVFPLPEHPEIVQVGFLDEATKRDALNGCLALVQPSYFESFSLVLCEAWLQSRPALVQGRCDVLAGQARRSAGALPYQGFAEFEAGLDWLIENPSAADQMGRDGRDFVERSYNWPTVIDHVEATVDLSVANFDRREWH